MAFAKKVPTDPDLTELGELIQGATDAILEVEITRNASTIPGKEEWEQIHTLSATPEEITSGTVYAAIQDYAGGGLYQFSARKPGAARVKPMVWQRRLPGEPRVPRNVAAQDAARRVALGQPPAGAPSAAPPLSTVAQPVGGYQAPPWGYPPMAPPWSFGAPPWGFGMHAPAPVPVAAAQEASLASVLVSLVKTLMERTAATAANPEVAEMQRRLDTAERARADDLHRMELQVQEERRLRAEEKHAADLALAEERRRADDVRRQADSDRKFDALRDELKALREAKPEGTDPSVTMLLESMKLQIQQSDLSRKEQAEMWRAMLDGLTRRDEKGEAFMAHALRMASPESQAQVMQLFAQAHQASAGLMQAQIAALAAQVQGGESTWVDAAREGLGKLVDVGQGLFMQAQQDAQKRAHAVEEAEQMQMRGALPARGNGVQQRPTPTAPPQTQEQVENAAIDAEFAELGWTVKKLRAAVRSGLTPEDCAVKVLEMADFFASMDSPKARELEAVARADALRLVVQLIPGAGDAYHKLVVEHMRKIVAEAEAAAKSDAVAATPEAPEDVQPS